MAQPPLDIHGHCRLVHSGRHVYFHASGWYEPLGRRCYRFSLIPKGTPSFIVDMDGFELNENSPYYAQRIIENYDPFEQIAHGELSEEERAAQEQAAIAKAAQETRDAVAGNPLFNSF